MKNGQSLKYFLKKGGMLILVNFVFAVLGIVGTILPWNWVKVAFGLIMFVFLCLILILFGYSESFHGSLLISKAQKKKTDVASTANNYAPWKGFVISAVAEGIPFLLLTLGLAIGGFRRTVQVILTFYYSCFSSICAGFSGVDASIMTEAGTWQLPLLYLPMAVAILCHGIGYLVGGYRRKRRDRQIEIDILSATVKR